MKYTVRKIKNGYKVYEVLGNALFPICAYIFSSKEEANLYINSLN